MPKNLTGRLIFALFVLIALAVIARNSYHRYLYGQLTTAVEAGNVSAVRSLLNRGADPNGATVIEREGQRPYRRPLLALAMSLLSQTETTPFANPPRQTGSDPVDRAAMIRELRSHAEAIVCLLIERGANISGRPNEPSYLSQASRLGDLPVLRCLLEKGIAIDSLDPDHSAIGEALRYPTFNPYSLSKPGFMGTFRLQRGMRSFAAFDSSLATLPQERGRETENRRATRRWQVTRQMIQLLRAHGAPLTPAQAVELGDREALKELLDAPVSRQSLQDRGETVLSTAARKGDLEAVRMLLAHGVGADQRNEYQESALCIAARNGDVALVKLLLNRGADVNLPSEYVQPPLCAAAAGGSLEIVKLLVARGAQVNPASKFPTPLQNAIWSRQSGMVRFLLAQGADPKLRESSLTSLLSSALRTMPEVVPDLLQHGAHVNLVSRTEVERISSGNLPLSPLMTAVWYAPQYEAMLLRAGAEIGADRRLIMLAAARAGRVELFSKLLAYGADVNGADWDGHTALTEAISYAPSGVLLLLDHGADPNVVTHAQRTPLQLAAMTGDSNLVHLILTHGALIDARPERGHTALYYARKHNHNAIVTMLQRAGAAVDQ